ncbi:hypothetical protein LZ017_12155 [Pelomonas sp. CA6]|uniref:hypothetical protein n=1 Tax=Pelomonas sp. CA6 TaxID=2907999 RepID=UPI001F4BF2EC|nr:hypothetical protein [Pelomonas sp. CA6]MCH7344128.1 hypothetical protein [Pelomonas sp. CA6]
MVLKQLKQWFTVRANAARWRAFADWADQRKGSFRMARDGAGFVVELSQGLPGQVRIEWGPSQRSYIEGHELRMRCEMRLSHELQMMVIERELMERLEREVFEAYTDTLKTRIDTDTPEEMRWLVMFPKLPQIESKLLRERFGVLGINRELCASWLEPALADKLVQASQDLVPAGRPFVLMGLRGNAYLRTAMAEPDLDQVQVLCRLLEAAARALQSANQRLGEGGVWPTTTSVAWHSRPPEGENPTPV